MSGSRCWLAAGVLALASLAISCTKVLEGVPEGNTTVTPPVQQIFTANCTTSGCHNGTSQAGGLNLDPGAADRAIGKQSDFDPALVVAPGNPDQSTLFQRLVASGPAKRMPPGLAPLSQDDIDEIREWIAALTAAPSPSPSPTPTPISSAVPSGSPTVGLANDVMPIFRASCATSGCHDARTRQNNVDLSTAAAAFASMLGGGSGATSFQFPPQRAVVPGDPGNSVLFVKIASEAPRIASQPIGARMPSGLPPLPAAQIETIRLWISQGARNN